MAGRRAFARNHPSFTIRARRMLIGSHRRDSLRMLRQEGRCSPRDAPRLRTAILRCAVPHPRCHGAPRHRPRDTSIRLSASQRSPIARSLDPPLAPLANRGTKRCLPWLSRGTALLERCHAAARPHLLRCADTGRALQCLHQDATAITCFAAVAILLSAGRGLHRCEFVPPKTAAHSVAPRCSPPRRATGSAWEAWSPGASRVAGTRGTYKVTGATGLAAWRGRRHTPRIIFPDGK